VRVPQPLHDPHLLQRDLAVLVRRDRNFLERELRAVGGAAHEVDGAHRAAAEEAELLEVVHGCPGQREVAATALETRCRRFIVRRGRRGKASASRDLDRLEAGTALTSLVAHKAAQGSQFTS
jgi:hypothetical protein